MGNRFFLPVEGRFDCKKSLCDPLKKLATRLQLHQTSGELVIPDNYLEQVQRQ